MPMRTFFILALVTFAGVAEAAQVVKIDFQNRVVWLSGRPSRALHEGDGICLYSEKRLLSCGNIKRLEEEKIAVALSQGHDNMVVGEKVSVHRRSRTVASADTTNEASNKLVNSTKNYTFDLGVGMTAGPRYYYPNAILNFAFTRDFAIGFNPIYASTSNNTDSYTAFGGYVTLTYYYTHYAFKGVFFQLGGGFFNITLNSATGTDSVAPIAGMGAVGWRGKALWDLGLDIGVSIGAQYLVYNQVQTTFETTFKGLMPMGSVFLAYSF